MGVAGGPLCAGWCVGAHGAGLGGPQGRSWSLPAQPCPLGRPCPSVVPAGCRRLSRAALEGASRAGREGHPKEASHPRFLGGSQPFPRPKHTVAAPEAVALSGTPEPEARSQPRLAPSGPSQPGQPVEGPRPTQASGRLLPPAADRTCECARVFKRECSGLGVRVSVFKHECESECVCPSLGVHMRGAHAAFGKPSSWR